MLPNIANNVSKPVTGQGKNPGLQQSPLTEFARIAARIRENNKRRRELYEQSKGTNPNSMHGRINQKKLPNSRPDRQLRQISLKTLPPPSKKAQDSNLRSTFSTKTPKSKTLPPPSKKAQTSKPGSPPLLKKAHTAPRFPKTSGRRRRSKTVTGRKKPPFKKGSSSSLKRKFRAFFRRKSNAKKKDHDEVVIGRRPHTPTLTRKQDSSGSSHTTVKGSLASGTSAPKQIKEYDLTNKVEEHARSLIYFVEKLESLGSQVESLKKQLESLKEKFRSLGEQLKSLGGQLKPLKKKFESFGSQLESLKKQVDNSLKSQEKSMAEKSAILSHFSQAIAYVVKHRVGSLFLALSKSITFAQVSTLWTQFPLKKLDACCQDLIDPPKKPKVESRDAIKDRLFRNPELTGDRFEKALLDEEEGIKNKQDAFIKSNKQEQKRLHTLITEIQNLETRIDHCLNNYRKMDLSKVSVTGPLTLNTVVEQIEKIFPLKRNSNTTPPQELTTEEQSLDVVAEQTMKLRERILKKGSQLAQKILELQRRIETKLNKLNKTTSEKKITLRKPNPSEFLKHSLLPSNLDTFFRHTMAYHQLLLRSQREGTLFAKRNQESKINVDNFARLWQGLPREPLLLDDMRKEFEKGVDKLESKHLKILKTIFEMQYKIDVELSINKILQLFWDFSDKLTAFLRIPSSNFKGKYARSNFQDNCKKLLKPTLNILIALIRRRSPYPKFEINYLKKLCAFQSGYQANAVRQLNKVTQKTLPLSRVSRLRSKSVSNLHTLLPIHLSQESSEIRSLKQIIISIKEGIFNKNESNLLDYEGKFSTAYQELEKQILSVERSKNYSEVKRVLNSLGKKSKSSGTALNFVSAIQEIFAQFKTQKSPYDKNIEKFKSIIKRINSLIETSDTITQIDSGKFNLDSEQYLEVQTRNAPLTIKCKIEGSLTFSQNLALRGKTFTALPASYRKGRKQYVRVRDGKEIYEREAEIEIGNISSEPKKQYLQIKMGGKVYCVPLERMPQIDTQNRPEANKKYYSNQRYTPAQKKYHVARKDAYQKVFDKITKAMSLD